MTDNSKQPPENAGETSNGNWDSYWNDGHDSEAFSRQGTSHPAIRHFWIDVFGSLSRESDTLRLADFCSGNGAVVSVASEIFADDLLDICCIDQSSSAIQTLQNRFTDAQGIVSDVRSTPLQDSSYRVVSGQFGSEYPGVQGMDEMIRVLATGGRVALLIHYREGVIFQV